MALSKSKIFCIEVAAIMCFFIAVIIVLEVLFADCPTRIDYLYASIRQTTDSVEVAIVGNSHAGAIGKPSVLHVEKEMVGNYSVSGQDLFHAQIVISDILKQKNKLKYIVLFVDYDMLGYDLLSTNQRYTDREYYKYADTMQDMSLANRLMATSNFFRCNRDFSVLKEKYKRSESNNETVLKQQEENFIPVTTTNDEKEACRHRATEMTGIKFTRSLVGENQKILQNIIDRVLSSNVQLIIVVPPKRSCFYEYANKENTKLSKDALYQIVESNNVVCFVDMYGNEMFNDDDFVDADHLNPSGVDKIKKVITNEYFSDEHKWSF